MAVLPGKYTQTNIVSVWLAVVSLLLGTLMRAHQVQAALSRNLISLNKASVYLDLEKILAADRIRATERQAGLERFVAYLSSSQNRTFSLPSVEIPYKTTMLRSIFIGEYHRFRGDMDEAARWYLRAVQSDPHPLWQDSLLYARRDRLLPDGNILITDFADLDGWIPHWNSNNDDATIESSSGIALVSYPNHLNQRDLVGYLLYPERGLQLGYHKVLSIRVKVETGSFLTIDVQVDGSFERVLNYYKGTGDWETLQFPLTGDMLQAISLSISEPGQLPKEMVMYRVWGDWIHLQLSR